jgi:hypothetical protein
MTWRWLTEMNEMKMTGSESLHLFMKQRNRKGVIQDGYGVEQA